MSNQTIADNVSRSELEVSIAWGRNNPALYSQSVRDFHEKFGNGEWFVSRDVSREGFITFVAVRKSELSDNDKNAYMHGRLAGRSDENPYSNGSQSHSDFEDGRFDEMQDRY